MSDTLLILGAGNNRKKRLRPDCLGFYDEDIDVSVMRTIHTLDMDKATAPDILHDLENVPWPIRSNTYDEVHAYEVLEHFGKQGDFRAFFTHFGELWRILKPGGALFASVPVGKWVWGDPGHTREISACTLTYLFKREYEKQIGITAMTDYRNYLVGDWNLQMVLQDFDGLRFIVRAKK